MKVVSNIASVGELELDDYTIGNLIFYADDISKENIALLFLESIENQINYSTYVLLRAVRYPGCINRYILILDKTVFLVYIDHGDIIELEGKQFL